MREVTADDNDELVSIVAVSIFAVRSRKWAQFSRMDKEFPPKRFDYACRSPRWFSWQPRNLLKLGRECESRCS